MNYRNKKTGLVYKHLAFGVDRTNSRYSTAVVIYCPSDSESTVYVQEEKEFYEEFEVVKTEVPNFDQMLEKVLKDLEKWTDNPAFKNYSASFQDGYKEALHDFVSDLRIELN